MCAKFTTFPKLTVLSLPKQISSNSSKTSLLIGVI